MTTYQRITADEAIADPTGVESFQAGDWHPVDEVGLGSSGTWLWVRFASGGTFSGEPKHWRSFRRAVVQAPASTEAEKAAGRAALGNHAFTEDAEAWHSDADRFGAKVESFERVIGTGGYRSSMFPGYLIRSNVVGSGYFVFRDGEHPAISTAFTFETAVAIVLAKTDAARLTDVGGEPFRTDQL